MAVERIVNLTVNNNIDDTTQSVGNLRTELRQAQADVLELSERFGATSEEAINAARRAAELTDAIGDSRALIDAFNPDAKFKALTATLGGVAAGFSVVQGAVGLLGDESESVEKMILKVQSAMAISEGIQALGESVDSFRQLGAVIRATTLYQRALAAATAIQTFVMNGATLAARALRGALIATGVGALVVGVGLLIANFDKVKKVVMNLIPGLSSIGDVVMSIVNSVTDFIGVTSEAERANERLKASAAASIALNKKYLAEHGSQLDEFTKQKLAAKDKYNEAIQEENADRVALAKELNRELVNIDKARQDEKDKKDKDTQDKIDEAEKKRLEKIKEANEAAQKIRDAAYEHEKLFVEEQLKDSKLSIDEKRNIVIADMALSKKDREKFLYDLHLEEQKSEQEHAEKLKDINKRYDEEKENRLADTNVKKEELDYQRRKLEIESIAQTETEKLNLIAKLNEEHDAKMLDAKKADGEKQLEIDKTIAEGKKAIQESSLNVLSQGISLAKDLAGKNKALQKGLLIAESAIGIAKIVTSTQSANAAVVAKYALIPGGPALAATEIGLNYAGAAIGTAANIAATSKALQALGGGGSAGSASGGGKAATPPQFNIVGQSGTNQLAQTIAGQQNKPIEAFVVSSAVSTSQALDRNRVRTATFGG